MRFGAERRHINGFWGTVSQTVPPQPLCGIQLAPMPKKWELLHTAGRGGRDTNRPKMKGDDIVATDRRAYYKQYYQAHKAEMLEAARERREKDPEKYIAISRKYREQHREEINRKRREKYHANIEESRAAARRYQTEHRDKVREYQRRFRAAHPDRIRA